MMIDIYFLHWLCISRFMFSSMISPKAKKNKNKKKRSNHRQWFLQACEVRWNVFRHSRLQKWEVEKLDQFFSPFFPEIQIHRNLLWGSYGHRSSGWEKISPHQSLTHVARGIFIYIIFSLWNVSSKVLFLLYLCDDLRYRYVNWTIAPHSSNFNLNNVSSNTIFLKKYFVWNNFQKCLIHNHIII